MKLNKYIDHTILKPVATEADIEKLCAEAAEIAAAAVAAEAEVLEIVNSKLQRKTQLSHAQQLACFTCRQNAARKTSKKIVIKQLHFTFNNQAKSIIYEKKSVHFLCF